MPSGRVGNSLAHQNVNAITMVGKQVAHPTHFYKGFRLPTHGASAARRHPAQYHHTPLNPPHAHTFGDEPSPLHFGFQAAFFPTPPFPPSPASGRGNSGAAYFLGHHPIKLPNKECARQPENGKSPFSGCLLSLRHPLPLGAVSRCQYQPRNFMAFSKRRMLIM